MARTQNRGGRKVADVYRTQKVGEIHQKKKSNAGGCGPTVCAVIFVAIVLISL